MTHDMKKRIWILLAVLVCVCIFYFSQSSMFGSESTGRKISVSILSLNKDNVRELNFLLRKGAHLALFALLAVFVKSALSNRRRSYWIAWLVATLYGYTDEFHQAYIPGRGASMSDVLLDSLGAGIGLAVYFICARLLKAGTKSK